MTEPVLTGEVPEIFDEILGSQPNILKLQAGIKSTCASSVST
jgi:hypothetical protein